MADKPNSMTLNEVVDVLEQDYGISYDGVCSDIDCELSAFSKPDVEGLSSVQDEQVEILSNLHDVDLIETDEEEETVAQSGKILAYNFSNTKWSNDEYEGEIRRGAFTQDVGPATILPEGLSSEGQSVFRFKGPITAVTWMDNRVVNMVSSQAIPSDTATIPVKR